MPSNKHVAIFVDASEFADFRTDSEDYPDGVTGIVGIREDETSDLQSLLFDPETWTLDMVNEWLTENGYEALEVEAATVEDDTADDTADMSQRKLHVVQGRPLNFDATGDGELTLWHILLHEGETVYDSWGCPIETSAEWLSVYAKAFSDYTREGEFFPPVLFNHDCFGERCGDLLECRYMAEGPQGAGLYFKVAWQPEMKDAIEAGKWAYASISLWEDVTDWDNTHYSVLPMEISVTNIPQVTTLPTLADGVAALNRRTALSRAKRLSKGGKMDKEKSTSPVDAGGEKDRVDLSAMHAENAALRTELNAMSKQVIALRRERSQVEVEADIAEGFWSVKDDVERTNFGRLVKLHMERPDDYTLFKSCSPKVERVSQRLGSRGSDVDTEVVSFRRRSDMLTFYRDRAQALSAEKGVTYVEALKSVKQKYPENEIFSE